MVQVVLIVPTIMLPAGLVYMIYKAIMWGPKLESLWIGGFVLLHAAVFMLIYWALAYVLAKLLLSATRRSLRLVFLAAVFGALLVLNLQPIYGGGGHGPMRLSPLPQFASGMVRDYDLMGLISLVLALVLIVARPLFKLIREASVSQQRRRARDS